MPLLPNAENAQIPIKKLKDYYCLNENHPKGKHKARVFLAVPSHTAAASYRLSDFNKGIILFANALYFSTQRSYNNQIQIDNNYNLYSRLPVEVPQQRVSAGGRVDKYLSLLSTTLKLHGNVAWSEYQNRLNSEILRQTEAWNWNIELTLHTGF